MTKEELWKVQLEQWPNSVELTHEELFRWARAPLDRNEQHRRWRNIAYAIQFPVAVFYITNPKCGYVGCWYGLEPHEYLSGYTDVPVWLVNNVLEELEWNSN